MKSNKAKIRVIIFLLLLLLAASGVAAKLYLDHQKMLNAKTVYFLAADNPSAIVYDEELNEHSFPRGMAVEANNRYLDDEKIYRMTFIGEEVYYTKAETLKEDQALTVLEDTIYIRNTTVLYEDEESSKIKGMVPKGGEFAVNGHNFIDDNGIVDRYKITTDEGEGYVLGKYALLNKEEVVDTIPEVHLDRNYDYGGGIASTIEFPVIEKVEFSDNPILRDARTIYLNADSLSSLDAYIDLALASNVNAFVIDIRDSHIITYASDVMYQYSPSSYEHGWYDMDEMKEFVRKVNDAGIYTIGRITTFKDTYYAQDNPDYSLISANGTLFEYESSYWPSAFQREVWEYNVELAKEAISEIGFKEVQFDYCRFPDRVTYYENQGMLILRNTYDETKVQALERFLCYATDEIHKIHGYVSVDVFGESAFGYVTAYGQYWPAFSNVVDAISGMPYPDHFSEHAYGIAEPVWTVPYQLLTSWGAEAYARQQETPSKAIVRTWLQGYSSIREPYVDYNASMFADEVRALRDSGLDGGYIVWNAASSYERYASYSEVFKGNY